MSKIVIPETCYPELESTIADWVRTNLGSDPSYDESLQSKIDQWGLPWFRAGAIVRNAAGKILMMHEGRIQIKKIESEAVRNFHLSRGLKKKDWICGDGGWNLPSGRLRIGETFEDAARREVEEESGWDITLSTVVHVRHSEKPDNQYILPVYFADANNGPEQYRTEETMEIGWFSAEEIQAMHTAGMLRSPDFVLDTLAACNLVEQSE